MLKSKSVNQSNNQFNNSFIRSFIRTYIYFQRPLVVIFLVCSLQQTTPSITTQRMKRTDTIPTMLLCRVINESSQRKQMYACMHACMYVSCSVVFELYLEAQEECELCFEWKKETIEFIPWQSIVLYVLYDFENPSIVDFGLNEG